MKEDVLAMISETITEGVNHANDNLDTEHDRWIAIMGLLTNIKGLCDGAILMNAKDKVDE